MQLIKQHGESGSARLPFTLDDRFAMAVLALVCLCSGWGPNIFQTEGFVLVISAFGALSLSIRDRLVGAIGLYLSIGYMTLFALQAFNISKIEPALIASSLHIATASLIVYIGIRFGSTDKEKWFNVICAISCALAVLGIFGWLKDRPSVAMLGNQNFLGAFLTIGAFTCCDRKRWPWLFVILPALWFCRTATAAAAFIAGLGFMAWRWKGVALSIIPGALYIAFVKKGVSSFLDRVTFWQDAAYQLSASWHAVLFGKGPAVHWRTDNTLHSMYADIFWSLGIAGLILAGLYIWRSLKISADRRLSAMLVAICVDGIGNHILGMMPTATLAASVCALNDRNLREV